MLDLGKGMQLLIHKVLVKVGDCPHCGEPMYMWKNKKPNGDDRCDATCMECGYHNLKMKADQETNRRYENNLKKRAVNLLKYSSILSDKELLNKNFENYQAESVEERTAVHVAKHFVDQTLSGENKHLIFSGKSGSGKSHLSMATLWEILERSNYDKKCLFINYRELLEMFKNSMNEPVFQRQIVNSIMQDIKTVNVVVLDDLGADLGKGADNGSTSYNNDKLYSILEARQNKPLIVTTNLSGSELKAAYGERILSRILNHSKGFTVTFKQTNDKRIKGIS